MVYLLNRETGKPLADIVEKPVPAGNLEGERYSPTQPYSVGMPSFGNDELYQPVLVSDGVVGMNCRVLKSAEDDEGSVRNAGENDKQKFEDAFTESNAVPYKVELTFFIESPDEELRSRSRRAPMVRIVRLPIHEQSLDGAAPPNEDAKQSKDGKGAVTGGKGGLVP